MKEVVQPKNAGSNCRSYQLIQSIEPIGTIYAWSETVRVEYQNVCQDGHDDEGQENLEAQSQYCRYFKKTIAIMW
jgi:hypothetical protein